MSFFEDLKDIHSLKQQAEAMQAQLANERVEGKSSDSAFVVLMNGNQEVLGVTVPEGELNKTTVEAGVKEAFADARIKIEDLMKKNMGGMLT